MRFLLDENLPRSLAEYLTSAGHDMLEVAASSLRSSPDKALWAEAARAGRTIITRDLDFPIRGYKPVPFAVILVRVPFYFTAAQILGIFRESVSRVKFEDLENKVMVLAPGKIRISPLP